MPRPLGAATYTYLFVVPLDDALGRISELGFGACEIMATPPHVGSQTADRHRAGQLRARLDALGLELTTWNPTYLDLNLGSTNDDLRAHSVAEVSAAIDFGADVGASRIVVGPGRQHPLVPAPMDWLRPKAVDAIARCVARAEERGVTVVLENSPSGFSGFLNTGEELAAVCAEIDSPACRILFDVANAWVVGDPIGNLRAAAPYLSYVHLSDTEVERWGHWTIGEGEVDCAAVAAALDEIGFDGPTTLEVIDPGRPDEALRESAERLEDLGWTRG